MKILFCGGGTAGHTTPNIALIELLHRQASCHYMGTDGMEKSLTAPLCDNGTITSYHTINAVKLSRKLDIRHLALPYYLNKSVRQASIIIAQLRPDVIFAKGGYVSLPAVIAGHRLHIPTIVHESDMSLGLANKVSRFYASKMLSTFDNTPHCQSVGAILRPSLYNGNRQNGLDIMGFDGNKPILLVMGGSLGANQLNQLITQCPQLESVMDIFIITGRGKALDTHLHQAQYINNMADLYAGTTICLTRGGANSLIELTSLNIPYVSVPLTNQSRGEQIDNSNYFAQRGCCKTLTGNITPQQLMDTIMQVYNNIAHYKDNLKKLHLDATHKVANIIMSYQPKGNITIN